MKNPKTVRLELTQNGELVLANSDSESVWKSHSGSTDIDKQPYQLKIHNDGFIVILDSYNSPVWSSLYQIFSNFF